jgi:methylmalonyl-CoA/ethylmalonyl-CoA epimerase
MPPRFHHVGYATRSIENSVSLFRVLGYEVESPLIIDKQLGVKVLFLSNVESGNHRIELVEDLIDGDRHPILDILRQRPGSYHLAFMTDSIRDFSSINRLRALSKCLPALAFEGRHVQFFVSRDEGIIELISTSFTCECTNAK